MASRSISWTPACKLPHQHAYTLTHTHMSRGRPVNSGAACAKVRPSSRRRYHSAVLPLRYAVPDAPSTLRFFVEHGVLWSAPCIHVAASARAPLLRPRSLTTSQTGAFNSTDTEIRWDSAATPVLDFWVTAAPAAGNPFKSMLGEFADVTGHPPPMPDFATGFWQCKNRYRSQEELLATAHE